MTSIPDFIVNQKSYHVDLNQLQKAKSTWRGKMVTIGEGDQKIQVKYNDVLKHIASKMKLEESLALFKELKLRNIPGILVFKSADSIGRRKILNKVIEEKYGGQKSLFEDPVKYYSALKLEGYDPRLLSSKELRSQRALSKKSDLSHTITAFMGTQLKDSLKQSNIDFKNIKSADVYIEVLRPDTKARVIPITSITSEEDFINKFEKKCLNKTKHLNANEEIIYLIRLKDDKGNTSVLLNGVNIKEYSPEGNVASFKQIKKEEFKEEFPKFVENRRIELDQFFEEMKKEGDL